MPIFEIRVHFEADRADEVDRLVEKFERAICPHPADQAHRCPNRWNIITIELNASDAAQLDALLNE